MGEPLENECDFDSVCVRETTQPGDEWRTYEPRYRSNDAGRYMSNGDMIVDLLQQILDQLKEMNPNERERKIIKYFCHEPQKTVDPNEIF